MADPDQDKGASIEEFRQVLPDMRGMLHKTGIDADDEDTLVAAAGVGITYRVWRNSPIEDAHAGERGLKNGLHDGVMFARNTWVTRQAIDALTKASRWPLLEFERAILDRQLVWPGTSGTLQQFGRGTLGALSKHVKQQINSLLTLQEELKREEFLVYLGAYAAWWARDHFGMPAWPRRVEIACRRIRGEDRDFEAWLAADTRTRPTDFASFIAEAPAIVREGTPAVERALLREPYELGADVLDWFAWNPILDEHLSD